MKSPIVSIVIPTRNRAMFLTYALTSCLNQTYTNLQIIVHDNNSSDNTRELVQKKFKDKRIAYYNPGRDLTMQDNWNKAVSYIKGEYFLRLDDDNVLNPTIIEEALKNIQEKNLHCLAYFPIVVHPDRKLTIFFKESEKIHLLNKFQLLHLTYYCIIDSNCVIYKTQTIKKLLGKKFYITTLPDRHLDYTIACKMQKEGIRYGLSTKIKAVTRHDYKSSDKKTETNELDLTRIRKECSKVDIKSIDCHNNFMLHRYVTATIALANKKDKSIWQYFNKKISTFNNYELIYLIGMLYELNRFYSIKYFTAYLKIFLYTISQLIIKPRLVVEGKKAYNQILFLFALLLFRTQKSLLKKEIKNPDILFGNELCRKMLSTGKVDIRKARIEFGSAQTFLRKIR